MIGRANPGYFSSYGPFLNLRDSVTRTPYGTVFSWWRCPRHFVPGYISLSLGTKTMARPSASQKPWVAFGNLLAV
jgi:hypothetical protein